MVKKKGVDIAKEKLNCKNTFKIGIFILLLFGIIFLIYAFSPLFYDKEVDEEFSIIVDKPELIYSGVFQGADSAHQVSGNAEVYSSDEGLFLYLSDFKSTNGPDLMVYLATDTGAIDFVSLGDLKGNIGNQYYEIPMGVDLEKYGTVLIWCEAFGVHFGDAKLKVYM